MLLRDFVGAAWGTGHSVAPPSIFQTCEEFRRHFHLYRGLRWLSVGESRPKVGLGECVFKNFIPGANLCLRKNHEAETHFEERSMRGETWSMNPDDVHHARALESPRTEDE